VTTQPSAKREIGQARAALQAAAPSPQPADERPPTSAGWAGTLVQLVALAALVAGVHLLAGLGWALVIGGTLVLVGSVLVEYLATRPPRPAPAPAPGGDR